MNWILPQALCLCFVSLVASFAEKEADDKQRQLLERHILEECDAIFTSHWTDCGIGERVEENWCFDTATQTEVCYLDDLADCCTNFPPARDIVFLLDGSRSIDSDDWTLQLEGIINALRNFVEYDQVDQLTSITVVQFSDSARIEVPYTVVRSSAHIEEISTAILAISQLFDSTSPLKALYLQRNTSSLSRPLVTSRNIALPPTATRTSMTVPD